MENTINTALVLAGGLGTRLRPITNITPKPLVKVGKKPIIAHIIDELSRNGIHNVYVSVGYKADKIINYLEKYKTTARIRFMKEEKPLGTGGAVKLALRKIHDKDSNIFMIHSDDLFRIGIKRMLSLGWGNKYSSIEAVEKAVDEALLQMGRI